ncbi:MAG: DUF1566 domain-containing protein, partial [Nitrospiraceae bacterium]|nr:DUF1566 domain-containing protein [Nitrospiraceae bacterium]
MYLSNNNTLQNNIASNNCYGIYIEVSNGNTLSDNTANSNNYNGITLQSSSDNMLINNTASYSNKNYRYHGIWLYNSSNNNLTNNIANSNGYIGIYIEVSNDNTLCENTANSNNFSGICIGRLSDNNLIYHNNLIDNTNYNAYDISTNQWDSGTEGNYYSDYTGTDSDGDGIGDTPYPIPGGSSVDRYPLMAPYSPTPLPFPRFIDNNDGTVTDQLTGLMWTKITDYPNRNLNWYEALNYVSDMNQGIINNFGYHDWRLPNVEEFEDIADPRNIAPGLPTGHPFIIRSYGGQWSSSTVVDNPNRAYMFSLYHGTISSNGKLMGGALVWPVRGGLSVPPTTDIILISPNGGENWQAGTTQTIQWSYSGNPGSNVKIELLKGGVVDSIITSSTPMGSADSGSFNWEIPSTQTPGTDYQIKITSTSDTAYTDISDCFSISADPAISSTFGSSDQNVLLSPEPINVGTGSYIYQHHDMSISGRGLPLTITRSYNSMDIYSGPLGSGWTFNYNVNLVVGSEDVVVMREDGRRDIYSSNPDGTYSPPLNVYDTLDKNPDNTFTLTRKDKVEYNFSPQGKLNNIIDKNNNQISLTYTGDYLIKVTDASGKELIFTYDVAGRIIAITGHVGRTWSYTYDDESNLIRYTNPMGGQFSYTYDENHWMTSITDPRGNQIMTNTYDGEGRVISQSNALGAIYTFSYDVENRETTEIDPLGGTKIYAYDEHFWGLSETDQLGNTIYYAYDEDGNRISVTNANGQTTQFAYDANGDIIQITDPLGYITSMTYDSKDNLISVTDALGRQIFLEYDANSNLVGAINALGDDTHFTYDEHGQLISGTDANGHTANFGYDADGNQIAVTDALGNTVAFTYDSVCRLITTTDANGNTYTLLYDNLDRLVSVTDPLGYTASNTYDPVGNRISFTDPAGSLTSYSYDPLNQLTEVTDAMGGTVHYNYDIIGNMISMTDANGHTTNY